MKRLVVDTSVLIDFLRQKDKTKTLLYTIATEDLYISIISHTELFAGKSIWEKASVRQDVEQILAGLTIFRRRLVALSALSNISNRFYNCCSCCN